MIEDCIIVEIKAVDAIHETHKAQLTDYLRTTSCKVGFAFNFGPEAGFEGRYYRNAKKPSLKNLRESA